MLTKVVERITDHGDADDEGALEIVVGTVLGAEEDDDGEWPHTRRM